MTVTVKELEANLDDYLTLAATEDIYISRNGKIIANLTSPYDIVNELAGSIPATVTLEEARDEYISKI